MNWQLYFIIFSRGSGYEQKHYDARWVTDAEQYDWALVAGDGDWDYSWNSGVNFKETPKELITTTSAPTTTAITGSPIEPLVTNTTTTNTTVAWARNDWDSWSQECDPDCDRTTSATSTSGSNTETSTSAQNESDIFEAKMVKFVTIIVVVCLVVLGIGTFIVIRLCQSSGHTPLDETHNETQMTVINDPIIQVPPTVETGHLVSILVPGVPDTPEQPERPLPTIPKPPQLPVPILPVPIVPPEPVLPPVPGVAPHVPIGGEYFRPRLTPVKLERQKSDQGQDDLQGRLERQRAKHRANKSGPAMVVVPVYKPGKNGKNNPSYILILNCR